MTAPAEPGRHVRVVDPDEAVGRSVASLDDGRLPITGAGIRGGRRGKRSVDAGLRHDVSGCLPPRRQPDDLRAGLGPGTDFVVPVVGYGERKRLPLVLVVAVDETPTCEPATSGQPLGIAAEAVHHTVEVEVDRNPWHWIGSGQVGPWATSAAISSRRASVMPLRCSTASVEIRSSIACLPARIVHPHGSDVVQGLRLRHTRLARAGIATDPPATVGYGFGSETGRTTRWASQPNSRERRPPALRAASLSSTEDLVANVLRLERDEVRNPKNLVAGVYLLLVGLGFSLAKYGYPWLTPFVVAGCRHRARRLGRCSPTDEARPRRLRAAQIVGRSRWVRREACWSCRRKIGGDLTRQPVTTADDPSEAVRKGHVVGTDADPTAARGARKPRKHEWR